MKYGKYSALLAALVLTGCSAPANEPRARSVREVISEHAREDARVDSFSTLADQERVLGDSTAKLPVLADPAKPKALQHVLRLISEAKAEDIALTGAAFAIGRHPRNDLVLKDPRISSFHCRIEREGEGYALVDLKSRNGTLLKAARIDRAPLKDGDVIQLGSTRISYSAR